jgi:hypothetical protein
MTLLTKLSNKQPLQQHALVQAIGADKVVNKLDDVVSFLVNFMTESPDDEDIISTRDSIFCRVLRTSRCSEKRAIRGIAIIFESTLGDGIKRQAMDTVSALMYSQV